MYKSILIVLCSAVYTVYGAGGGMAELKSITGDAPYLGPGNAPAFIPQPQGFWGRPRFIGGGYGGSFGSNGPYYGNDIGFPFGGSPYGPDRFTSRSSSPFGRGEWYSGS